MTDKRIRVFASGQGVYRVTRGHLHHGVITRERNRWFYTPELDPSARIDVTAQLHDDSALGAIIDQYDRN